MERMALDPAPSIHLLDPADTDAMTAWNRTAREAYCTGREAAWWETAQTTLTRFRNSRPGRLQRALAAHDVDGRIVGTAEILADPDDPAEVEIGVLPTHRRRGIGTALAAAVEHELAGRTPDLVQTEVYTPGGAEFAQGLGLSVGNREHRLLRDLPVSAQELQDLERPDPRVRTFSWTGPVPEELVVDWARLVTVMEEDVPLGELTRTTRTDTDVQRIRRNEERMAEQGWILVRSLAQLDGVSVGYTVQFLHREEPGIVTQDDTLVDRAHRGHGVGRALKIANLRQLQDLSEAAEARYVQTYTSTGNTPMLALNKTFGFHIADTMTALEGLLRTG